ncbi:MAG: hypothetical protein U0V87_05075 [Acidobacteriota bacterium]
MARRAGNTTRWFIEHHLLRLVKVTMALALCPAFVSNAASDWPPRGDSNAAATSSAESAGSRQSKPRTFVVENANDDGPGSLRWAILDANNAVNDVAPDTIAFAIPGDGPHLIRPQTSLPAIVDAVVIDGFSQAGSSPNTQTDAINARQMVVLDGTACSAGPGVLVRAEHTTIRGLVIRGFAGDAVRLEGGGHSRIEGNLIGGEVHAEEPWANAGSGVLIVDSRGNVVGGISPASRNEIVANGGHGVLLSGIDAVGNAVLGNRIVGNDLDGIALAPDASLTVRGSRIAANNEQNAPSLVSATRHSGPDGASEGTLLEGELRSLPSTEYHVEVFSTRATGSLLESQIDAPTTAHTARREGDKLVFSASVVTDPNGKAELHLLVPQGIASRASITATATDPSGNTSAFSAPVQAPLVTKSWNSTASGNWGDATKWTPSGVPTATDDVVITLAGTYTVTLNVSSQVASLTLGGSSGTQTLSMSANTLTLDGASSVTSFGALTQNGGTIAGAGTLVINGPFTWGGGAHTGTGTTTVNSALTVSGGGNHDISSSRTFNTTATTTWSATGGVRIGSGAVVNNTGTWDSQNTNTMSNPFGGTATFNNSGVFKKSVGTGNTTIASSLTAFNNSGTVQAQSGTIILQPNGTHSGGFNGAGGTVQFALGTHDLNAGASLAGAIQLMSGTLNLNTPISTATFNQSGGTLQGAATFTTTGLYTWTAGAMAGAGITNANGGMAISGIGKEVKGGRTLNNTATATYTGSGSLGVEGGSAINNSGMWDCQSDHLYTFVNGTRGLFNNLATGTFKKSAGIGETNMSLQMRNSGAIEVLSGRLIFTNGSASFIQTAGSTTLNGGDMDTTTPADFQGGTFTGVGSLTASLTNSARVAPGLQIGTLTIQQAYTQSAAGALDIQVGGLIAGTEYDQLKLTGVSAATLSGTLNVSLANGFIPPELSTYSIMTYPSHTGTFSNVTQPGTNCVGFTTRYDPTAVVLTWVHLPTEVHDQRIAADKTTISWGAPPPYAGTTFDVLRGRVAALPVGPGGGDESCIAQNIAATQTTDSTTPALGTSNWYLVRERVAGCGTGTWGKNAAGAERTTTSCP